LPVGVRQLGFQRQQKLAVRLAVLANPLVPGRQELPRLLDCCGAVWAAPVASGENSIAVVRDMDWL